MRKLCKSVVAAMLISAGGMGSAQALPVTFDELVPIDVISPCFGAAFACGGGVDSVIDSGNFRFTTFDNGVTHHGHLVSAPYASVADSHAYPYNGTQYIGLDTSVIVMSRIDGGAFSLQGFDAAEGYYFNNLMNRFAATLSVEAILSGGGTALAVFNFDGVNDSVGGSADFQTFLLPTAFRDVTKVTFTGLDAAGDLLPSGNNYFSIDNLNDSAATASAVPEPITLSLFGAGLVGITAMRRRKQLALV